MKVNRLKDVVPAEDGLVELQATASYIVDQWGASRREFPLQIRTDFDGFSLISVGETVRRCKEQSVEFVTGWHKDK